MSAIPPPARPRPGASVRTSAAPGHLTHLVLIAAVVAACSAPSPSRPLAPSRPATPTAAASGDPMRPTGEPATHLALLAGNPRNARLVVLDSADRATAVDLPDAATAWISADRAGRLLATTADGRLFLTGSSPTGGVHGGWASGDPGWREVVPAYAGTRPAAPLSFAVLAPDGRTIAALAADFARETAFDLVLLDAASGAATSLRIPVRPDGAAPAWLPDGGLVVVARDPGRDLAGLLLVHPGAPEPVVRVEREAYGIALSADGHIAAIDAADGRIAVGPAEPFLGADPATGPGTATPAPESGPGHIATGPPGAAPGPFALDPSGTRLAVVWLDDAEGPATVMRYRMDPDGPVLEAAVPVPAGASTAVVAWLP